MTRCATSSSLEVHHKRRNGGNSLDNAEVLCQPCHTATSTYGTPGESPAPFDNNTKQMALKRAGNQCECERSGGCH
jgi:5-methylcytosine-specific restriction endonuclease McrA